MSIIPVAGFRPAVESEPVGTGARPAQHPLHAPVPRTPPKPNEHRPSRSQESTPLPQDEVQVLRDSEADGEIVVKYLDGAGQVILQVPSSEVLSISRAINRDFAQQSKARSVAGSPSAGIKGGKAHGH